MGASEDVVVAVEVLDDEVAEGVLVAAYVVAVDHRKDEEVDLHHDGVVAAVVAQDEVDGAHASYVGVASSFLTMIPLDFACAFDDAVVMVVTAVAAK